MFLGNYINLLGTQKEYNWNMFLEGNQEIYINKYNILNYYFFNLRKYIKNGQGKEL